MLFRSINSPLSHIAVLGNALPRRCGLATYTSHSVDALRATFPTMTIDHYAMDDGDGVSYGPDVRMTIEAQNVSAFIRATAAIERSGAQLLWLHHEFGIYGGPAGSHILALLQHLNLPLVVTLHTVLERPDPDQRRVMLAIIGAADRLIVMAERAAELLKTVYQVVPSRIRIIPHGAPDRPFSSTLPFKRRLGLGEGPIILTFGLLSPGKGIEVAIRALPEVAAHHPDLCYLIVGATHPCLLRDQGEDYRDRLGALVRQLGVERHVRFVDRFLEDEELLDYLQGADVYLTPYLGRDQVTSGTLSYALAMGRPVIATPYFHAEEALAGGIGTLVPFGDSAAISEALLDYLSDPARLQSQSRMVWRAARSTIWQQNARAVMDVLSEAQQSSPVVLKERRSQSIGHVVQIDGIAAMTDDVGIIQHSIHGVPDRCNGYCIDDNARALMLLSETRAGDPAERNRLSLVYAAFVQHGWNAASGSFRNFMGYDRQWLEEKGSEDSNGRTIWALGRVARFAPQDFLRRWASGLFKEALPLVASLQSPRAIAFSMLGMAAMLEMEPEHEHCRTLLQTSLSLFRRLMEQSQRPAWPWFEIVLAYDNARLPQAMIEAGRVLDNADAASIGLGTLRWLLGKQRAPAGHFRPVGTDSFGRAYAEPLPFDQQPLEAAATIAACAAAYRGDPDGFWVDAARQALGWFEGANDLAMPLACEDGSLCYDGLTDRGVNLNRGAESILALQMARHSMAELTGETETLPQLALVR